MERTQSKTSVLLGCGLIGLALILSSHAVAQEPSSGNGNMPSTRIRRQILVSLIDRKLAVLEGRQVLRTFPVAVGAEVSPSPEGEFQIINRVANPAYYHPGTVIPAGIDNPIGPRWIGLDQKGYGIHGTNQPLSVGHAASHGCIRLRNSDVVQLFEMVRAGDMVEIRAQRDEQMAKIFGGVAATDTSAIAQARPVATEDTTSGQ
ncbi:MAG TPA: L,D-transpeptidase [Terriglobales bacterium]|nr:L,D-transpeptidase [Terriglobales bacterium]